MTWSANLTVDEVVDHGDGTFTMRASAKTDDGSLTQSSEYASAVRVEFDVTAPQLLVRQGDRLAANGYFTAYEVPPSGLPTPDTGGTTVEPPPGSPDVTPPAPEPAPDLPPDAVPTTPDPTGPEPTPAPDGTPSGDTPTLESEEAQIEGLQQEVGALEAEEQTEGTTGSTDTPPAQ